VESATGQRLHEELETTHEENCTSCGDLFYGTAVNMGSGMRICNHCFRSIRQAIIFDEAKVNPYGKGQGFIR
jgi:hypothetical protein